METCRHRPAGVVRLAVASLLTIGVLGACASGPSSREDVCGAFDELGAQMMRGNGVFSNPLFHKADHLSDVAGRYEEADLSVDSRALHRIAKSDSTSDLEITQATNRIAAMCGHQLSDAALFGG